MLSISRRARRLSAFALMTCAACGTSSSDPSPARNDADVFDASNGCETDDCGDADADTKQDIPQEIPSSHTVTFAVTNTGSSDLYLLTYGAGCTDLLIERQSQTGWDKLPTDWGIPIPGEGCCVVACDSSSGPGRFEAIGPGGTREVVWDGRALVLSDQTGDCHGRQVYQAARQPVEAGTYRVTVVAVSTLPACCDKADGAVYVSCYCGDSTDSTDQSLDLELCIASPTFSVEFTLDDTDAISVPVSVQ